MEVILREDIEKLGNRGEVVRVAPGLRPQFPAAQTPRRGRHGRQPQDRRTGAPGAPAQRSSPEG